MLHTCRRAVAASCRLILMAAALHIASAAATQYSYDAQNRLKTVTDSNGDTAEYIYDAVGNLLEVHRYAVDQLSILSFAPPTGPVGTAVTINGSGFDPIASGNQVTFNGAPATVDQATSNALAVTVPTSASSGKISVTAHGQIAQSADDFIVTADDGVPTIIGFTPTCIAADQVVTVTGTNFDVRPNATRVEVGEQVASSTVSAPTVLTLAAPRVTAGGNIRITTSKGFAESTDPLAVWPAGIVCGTTWAESHWTSVDGPPTAISMAQSKSSLLYFRGQKGQWLSVQVYNVLPSSSYVYVWLILPDGTTVTTSPFRFGPNDGYTIDLPPLPTAGTYAVRFQATSSAAVTANVVLESAAMLTADGPASHLVVDSGRSRRLAFTTDGTAELGLGITPVVFTPASHSAALSSIYSQDGSIITGWPQTTLSCRDTLTPSGCHIVVPPLQAGTYAVRFRADTGVASDATVWLSNDITPTLQPEIPQQVAATRYGQSVRLHFHGEAGSGVSIDLANLQIPQNAGTYVFVYDPDNKQLSASQVTTNYVLAGGSMLSVPFLSKTGTYTLLVAPLNGGPASFEATLDPGVPLVVDGPALDLSTNLQGKGVRLVVDAVAGQKLGIGITNLTVAGSTGNLTYNVYTPDGVVLLSSGCVLANLPGCEIDLGPLALAGRYAIAIQPPATAVGMSMRVQATNDIVVAGASTSQSIAIGRFGGNARVTLQGVPGAGQTISISDFATTPTGKSAVISVLRPDGRLLNSRTPLYVALDQSGSTGTIKIGDFPIVGAYDVFVDPRDAAQASFKVQVSPGVDVIGPGGIPTHKDVVPGPWVRAVFAGAEGDHKAIGLDVTSLTNPTGTSLSLWVFDPAGQAMFQQGTTSIVSTCSTSSGGCDFDLPDLLLAGNYQALAELPVAKPEDAIAQLSVTSDVVIQGLSGTFNLDVRGQNGRLLFDGTAGHLPHIHLTRLSSQTGTGRDVALSLYGPDGVQVYSGSLESFQTTANLNVPALPLTGAYGLLIDPSNGYPTDLSVTVDSP